MANNIPIIIIAGPTACGKTNLSIELAKCINGEIISADSMQIYKYMDIGTAKVTEGEKQGIKHYLIDELYPNEEYSVAIFQKKAKDAIRKIKSKNKVPIIVGGTGFYINALLYDNNFEETKRDDILRTELFNIAKTKGNEYLHNLLYTVDPESAEKIHFNNTKRVVRALEYFQQTGKKISEHNKIEKQRKTNYITQNFILNMDRSKLYDRINYRVDEMIKDGLIHEVEILLDKGYSQDLTSMQGIGYKEIVEYINNKISLEESIEKLKLNTRHYAKRQLTWFNRQLEGTTIYVDEFNNNEYIKKEILNYIQ